MRILSDFAEILGGLLVEHDLTPCKLAQALAISEKTVYVWKQGKQTPALSNLVALADFFGVSLDYLAGRSDKTEPCKAYPYMPFGDRVREVMAERGITTYALRKKSQYGSNFFKRWQRGTQPLLPTLIELADILDCTIDYLVGRER